MLRTGLVLGLGIAVGAFALAVNPGTTMTGAAAPALQGAPSLRISDCVKVGVGDRFELNINAQGVSNLIAWEVYFSYNRHLLEVISKDVQQLLNTGREPSVADFSDSLPNSTGFYRMGAADLGPGDMPRQGSVLVKMTLEAKAEGVSPATIYRGDYSGDGAIDFGPTLTGRGPQYLGDTDGDNLFDGSISSGQIAIGERDCVDPPPVLQPGESEIVPASTDSDPPGSEPGAVDPAEGDGDATDPGSDGTEGETDGNGTDPVAEGTEGETSSDTTSDVAAGAESDPGRKPHTPATSSGIADGIVPWMLIGLGVAVAGAGGITFYMIRAASRDPF